MKRKGKLPFDPKEFLAKAGEGKTISKYRKEQIVFSQGQVADAVFYIQEGKVKLTVVSEQGKEAVIAILGPSHFFGEGCPFRHPLPFFWRRMSERSSAAHRNNAGDGRMRNHSPGEGDHDRDHSQSTGVFRAVHVVPVDAEQSN